MDDDALLAASTKQLFELHQQGQQVVLELAPLEALELAMALVWAMKRVRLATETVAPWRVLGLLEDVMGRLTGTEGPLVELLRRERAQVGFVREVNIT